MSDRHARRLTSIGLGVILAAGLGGRADALPRYGPLELAGSVAAYQLIRHPDIDQYSFIMQRNTVLLRTDLSLIQSGRMLDQVDVPWIKQARLYALYRGVYDSVYDYTPGFNQKNIWGNKINLNLSDLGNSTRDRYKWENRLREAYIDVDLADAPLNFRIGRQQIVWGETDNFRMLDRVNPLDLTWHLQQETWDQLRVPMWMIKGMWRTGDLDFIPYVPMRDTFFEWYWNPGDWYPAKKQFLPRPWSAPILDPFKDPSTPPAGGRGLFNILNNLTPFDVNSLYKGTKLFRQGDYSRSIKDNSQVGVRFSAATGTDFPLLPDGLNFTLNYFYGRWNGGDDGTNAAVFKGILDPRLALQALKRGEAPVEAISPYMHTIGFSANYAEEEYTQTVFRMETIYEMGVPFLDTSKQFPSRGAWSVLSKDIYGVSKRDMWKGMIGFDRPTWIRLINPKSTVLILGQFFWHRLLNNPDVECNDPNEGLPCPISGQGKGFRGQFSTSGIATTGIPGRGVWIDKIRDWELLATLTATSFFRGGKFVPFLVYIIDPVNSYNQEVMWFADYFITNNFILNLSQRYFINTSTRPAFETWGVGGLNRGRSETGIKLTYTF